MFLLMEVWCMWSRWQAALIGVVTRTAPSLSSYDLRYQTPLKACPKHLLSAERA